MFKCYGASCFNCKFDYPQFLEKMCKICIELKCGEECNICPWEQIERSENDEN